MRKELYVQIEEYLNSHMPKKESPRLKLSLGKIDPRVENAINRRFDSAKNAATLYDVIVGYIERLKDFNFYKKNGTLNESAFYKYARIDKSTWSDIRYNLIVPNKKTLLKLVIALKLSEKEACDLMAMGQNSFDQHNKRDLLILALIDLKCYNIEEVYDVLEEYRLEEQKRIKEKKLKIKNVYENIYDTPEDKKDKEKNE